MSGLVIDGPARNGIILDVQRSSNDKVHLLVEVIRLDNYGEVITSFESLWVITQQNKMGCFI